LTLALTALALPVSACASVDRSVPATQGTVIEADPYSMSAPDKAYYQSLEEMYGASEIVVVGEVVNVVPGEVLSGGGVHPDEDGFPQMGVITVRVDEQLRGTLDSATVTVVRESSLNEGGELRPLILEGFRGERVGNKVLWFLEQSAGRGVGVYEMISFDGLLYIEDGVITTPRAGDGTLAHRTAGRSASEVIAELRVLATGAQP